MKRAATASPAHFDRSALCAPAPAHRPRKSDFPSRVVLLQAASLMRRCRVPCAVGACQRAVPWSALARPAAPSPPDSSLAGCNSTHFSLCPAIVAMTRQTFFAPEDYAPPLTSPLLQTLRSTTPTAPPLHKRLAASSSRPDFTPADAPRRFPQGQAERVSYDSL